MDEGTQRAGYAINMEAFVTVSKRVVNRKIEVMGTSVFPTEEEKEVL